MKFYLRTGTSSYAPTTGDKSTANAKYTLGANNASSGQQSLALSTTKGGASGGTSHSFNSDATLSTRTNYMGRWTSDYLDAQTISSGTWTFAVGLSEANTAADSLLSLCVYTAVPGGSAKKQTIYDASTDLGSEWSTSVTAGGRVVTFSGASVSVDAGDVLVIEVFRNTDADGQSMTTAYAQIIYFGGATEPTASSNVTATDTASYLDSPAAITLATFTGAQQAFRFYDDGTETGSTALQAQDANHTVDISGGDVAVLVRARIAETGGLIDGVSTDTYSLLASKNGGAYHFVDAILDTYDASNQSSSSAYGIAGSANPWFIGQSFTAQAGKVTTAEFMLSKTGAPPGNMYVEIYAHAGTFGTGSVGTGSPLATSDVISANSLTGSLSLVSFTFSGANQITLTGGTNYVIGVRHEGGTTGNVINMGIDSTSPTHAGNRTVHQANAIWVAQASDAIFTLYTELLGTYTSISSSMADGDATTNRLTGGTGSFIAGKFSDDGMVESVTVTKSNYTELLYIVYIDVSSLANGDTLDFRVYRNYAALNAYTTTPRITATLIAGFITSNTAKFQSILAQ